MRISFAVVIASLGLLLAALPASAHHSIAGEYFIDERTTIEGDVVQFLFRNPHSFVQVRSPDPKTGQMVNWGVEWNGAGRLASTGVNKDTLKPGDHVIILGQPGRTATEHRMHMLMVTRPSDGWKWGRDSRAR